MKELDGLSAAKSELSFEMKMKTIEMLALIRGVSPESLIEMEQLSSFKRMMGLSESDEEDICDDEEDREVNAHDHNAAEIDYLVGDTFEPDQDSDTYADQPVEDIEEIFQLDL